MSECAESAIAEPEKLNRIAERIKNAGIVPEKHLLRMKLFNGQSLMDLLIARKNTPDHVEMLIKEAQLMQSAYKQSKLTTSKAKPTDDWRAYISIPYSSEETYK